MNQYIPLYSQTSNGWKNVGENNNYAVNLDVGINEYTFSRPTPNNDFIVSTGLVNDKLGVKMVGGKGKNTKSKNTKSKNTKKNYEKSKEKKTSNKK